MQMLTRKTIAGFMMIVAGAPILWKTAYAFSTCESEIRAIDAAFIGTNDQLSNVFTKVLQYGPFENLTQRFMCYWMRR